MPGECNASLVQFDDLYEVVYTSKPVKDAPALTAETFVPRGMTALLDAIGRTIVETGKRLAAIPESDRPGKVIFVIQTDGQENVSRQYDLTKINAMIEHQKSVYSWDFMFIGSAKDLDVAAVALSLGINDKSTISYNKGLKGTTNVFVSAANYVSTARAYGSSAANFSVADKTAALEEDVTTTTGTTSVPL